VGADDASGSGMTLAWLLLQLVGCAVLIARAGYMLSQTADTLAKAYGWGRGWAGLALLATVTSLPELASGISAVAIVDAPDLAVGNALGACVVNLLFLVVVDALQRHQPMYREASATHLLSAGFGVVMLGFVALSLLTGARAPAVLHLGLYSPMLLGLYLLALKGVHGHERQAMAVATKASTESVTAVDAPTSPDRIRRAWRRFGMAALVVLVAGSWLPEVANALSRALGLSQSFVGTVLMAVVTTLPEMAVTLGALRLGALDMAIGNLLGSNLVQCRNPRGGRCRLCSGSVAGASGPGPCQHGRDGAGDDRTRDHRPRDAATRPGPAPGQLGQRWSGGGVCRERGAGVPWRGLNGRRSNRRHPCSLSTAYRVACSRARWRNSASMAGCSASQVFAAPRPWAGYGAGG